MTDIAIFDRHIVRKHRNRAANLLSGHDFLLQEAAHRMAERFADIKQTFTTALDLGCRNSMLIDSIGNKGNVSQWVQCDIAEKMLNPTKYPSICADEELLPFTASSFDLIISNLNLHWVNDLPGCFIQIHKALKKDGMFMATMFGGHTLKELRQAMLTAEIELADGVSPRISPFTDVKDAGALLQRAGFSLPVADIETITVMYNNAYSLMHDLRAMGETNALIKRPHTMTKSTLDGIEESYSTLFKNDEALLPATFDIITVTGWKH